ncbi:MAG: hypothetical protein ACHQCH_02485 [Solirubrobacterales bacterium]
MLPIGLALALALTGCETTAEKSSKLEKAAKHTTLLQTGLSITHTSTEVKVVSTTVLHDSEGAAVAVTLRNLSPHTLRDVPLAITVKDAGGKTLFRNDAPGLEAAFTSLSSLSAHGEVTWVDDQVPAAGQPVNVSAQAGVAPAAAAIPPKIEARGVHLAEEASSAIAAAGTIENRSKVAQRSLVVFVLARRAGRIVAAGRAVLPEVPAGSSVPFQAFFIGDPRGAQLQASAPATVLG